MSKLGAGFICAIIAGGLCFARQSDNSNASPILEGEGTSFDAQFTAGFNYDYLMDPTQVSFEYPKGYLGLNIPLKYGLDKFIADTITSGLAELFKDDAFSPTISAKQNANTTVRVEVPMMRGVGMFSNTQNFYLKYTNTLGAPRISFNPGLDSIDFFLKGMIAVPLEVSMGWESMTFGYAYQVNNNVKFALNVHRHAFRFDMAAQVYIDLLGYIELHLIEQLRESIGRQNFKHALSGQAKGHYDVEVWSPTFAGRFWRFGIVSRLGIDSRAAGFLSAKYAIPFFVNPETFETGDLNNPEYLAENMERFLNGDTDSIEYKTNGELIWRMPHGHTISFDIIPGKLWLSYTKLFGEVQMFLGDITTIRVSKEEGSLALEEKKVDFDAGVTVDHIILVHSRLKNTFSNLGVFSLDFRYGEKDNLLERVYPVPFGGGALLPVLNFGVTFGTKIQMLLELDVFPLSALKAGAIYYF
jgi:hypothetical protein